MSPLAGFLAGFLVAAAVLSVLWLYRRGQAGTFSAEARWLRRLVDEAPDAMAVVTGGKIVYANRQAARLAGAERSEQLVERSVEDFLPRELQTVPASQIRQAIERRTAAEALKERLLRPDGRRVDLEVSSTPTLWDGQPAAQVILRDITARRRTDRRLVQDAFHDPLTGLPNRALLLDRLDLLVEYSRRRPDHPFAVLFLDLDHFKTVNDTLGHLVGDQLLVSIGRRLQRCLRPADTVARFAGDEFALLLDGIGGLTRLRGLGVRLCVDDFGTGSPSLTHLHRFPVDALKVDRSLIREMGRGDERGEVVWSLLALANALQLEAVAEGVEVPAQLERIQALGCPNAQGFLLQPPVPADEAESLLESRWRWSGEPLQGPEPDTGRPEVEA